MKTVARFALPAAALMALAACGSADNASEEAVADTVEMPADEALSQTEALSVEGTAATTPAAGTAAAPAAAATTAAPAPAETPTAEQAARNAQDVAARAQEAANAAEAAAKAAEAATE